MLERFFRLREHNTTVRVEVLAGVTTFLTMAYIIFVQPAVLSGRMFNIDTGMDFGAVTTATWRAPRHSTSSMLWSLMPPMVVNGTARRGATASIISGPTGADAPVLVCVAKIGPMLT